MEEVYIVQAYRKPVSRSKNGKLRFTRPDDLGGALIKEMTQKLPSLNKESINVFKDLCSMLQNIDTKLSSEEIQTKIYEIGKNNNFKNLREFFKLIYQVLLGQDTGPRLGSFIKVFGIEKTYKLIIDEK